MNDNARFLTQLLVVTVVVNLLVWPGFFLFASTYGLRPIEKRKQSDHSLPKEDLQTREFPVRELPVRIINVIFLLVAVVLSIYDAGVIVIAIGFAAYGSSLWVVGCIETRMDDHRHAPTKETAKEE